MANILVTAALLPIIALCFFIYTKDKTSEPKGLLALIFFLGLFSVVPVVVCELVFDYVFPEKSVSGFILTFIHTFFGVALIEEFFKWLITKFIGYNNKEFDEVFDVIVYAVFASLGFACFENVLYVLQLGLVNAIFRALLAVPGHTCFAISMGYFFSKAKVGQINGNKKIYHKNLILSFLAPIFLHTMYDSLLFIVGDNLETSALLQLVPFLIFYIIMVIVCFITVDKVAKVQQNLTTNIENGSIAVSNQGYIYYNAPTNPVTVPETVPETVPDTASVEVLDENGNGVFPDKPVEIPTTPKTTAPVVSQEKVEIPHVCLVCGRAIYNENYCPRCGFKLK